MPPRRGRPPRTVGKPRGACAGVPRPASSLQHPSPQHPWLRHAPLPSCLPPSARTVTPLFMRSQVRARVGLCSSTASTPLSYLKNTFTGGHKPGFRWSRALPGLLTSPPTLSVLCACSCPMRHRLVRSGQVVVSGIPSFAGLPNYFSWAKDGPGAKTWRWP